MQFQGGFVAKEFYLLTVLQGSDNHKDHSSGNWTRMQEDDVFEPQDSNDIQRFNLVHEKPLWRKCTALRIDFDSSTDFYGRITLYQIQVWGEECL